MIINLPIELYTSDMPRVFEEFSAWIGETAWRRRAIGVAADIRGHPHLKEYISEENAVALALTKCSEARKKYGGLPPALVNDRTLYSAFQLASQTLALCNSSPAVSRKALQGRIRGAFKNPDDLRALQLELSVATHFARRGLSVSWPEMSGGGTFDMLVSGFGERVVEVECKLASIDKGRKIHRREALEALSFVQRKLDAIAANLRSGLVVVVTLPDRLPQKLRERQELLAAIAQSVLAGTSRTLACGTDIRIEGFDASKYPHLGPPLTSELRSDIDAITRTENRQAVILGRRGAGAMIVVLQSQIEDTFLQYVFNTMADAAKRQLSGQRAGLVLVGFEDVNPRQLVATAEQDLEPANTPTALRVAVSDFLGSSSRDHLVGAAFFSSSELVMSPDGVLSRSGGAYYFPKTESPFWTEEFRGLFADGS
jgi:hypothetical protein